VFDEGSNDTAKSDWIPHKERKIGYNHKHSKIFKSIKKNLIYRWAFIILNLLIAFKPIQILSIKKINLYSWNDCATIEILMF